MAIQDDVLSRALELPVQARAKLVSALLLSLESEPLEAAAAIDSAWAAELARRADEVLSGKVQLVDVEELLRESREDLRKRYGV